MRQIGLFGESNGQGNAGHSSAVTAAHESLGESAVAHNTIHFYPEFYCWLSVAHECVSNNCNPAKLWWAADRSVSRTEKKSNANLHPDFLQEARAASCHSNDDRWALLYSILWRLNHAAPFFKRRFSNMNWSILTPVGCAHWEGQDRIAENCERQNTKKPNPQVHNPQEHSQKEHQYAKLPGSGQLWFSEAVDKNIAPAGDQFEEAWRVYYKSIFNPARLKVSAMQSEMPKKYWKNLPEATEIHALIKSAESRSRRMIEQRKASDQLQCGARPEHPERLIQKQVKETGGSSLQALKLKASLCTDCPQSGAATQTVFGEGPANAAIMIIGEQPGDQEDLQGAPFVGPAGQVLSAALKRAGIKKEHCYLTNAVKHFGFLPRGKKRLHKRPDASVVSACGQWLQKELALVDPGIVIYLGVTAASTRFGSQVKINRDRGSVIHADNRKHLITAHPSSILRLGRGDARNRAYTRFINDLMLAAELQAGTG